MGFSDIAVEPPPPVAGTCIFGMTYSALAEQNSTPPGRSRSSAVTHPFRPSTVSRDVVHTTVLAAGRGCTTKDLSSPAVAIII